MNRYFLHIVMLISLFLSACNTRNEIEIVDKIDPSIISEDELDEKLPGAYADTVIISRFKKLKSMPADSFIDHLNNSNDVQRQLKPLYKEYKKSKNQFAYKILVNKNGIASKAVVLKSLKSGIDSKLIRTLSELPFNIGEVNGKAVEYFKIIDDNIFFNGEKFDKENEIEIISTSDDSYHEISLSSYEDLYYLNSRLYHFKAFALFNEGEIFKKASNNILTLAYEVYFGKDRYIDKIRILKGLGEKLDAEIINQFSNYRIKSSGTKQKKIKFVWRFRVSFDDAGKLQSSSNGAYPYQLDSENWKNIDLNKAEIVEEIDSSYISYEYTDQNTLGGHSGPVRFIGILNEEYVIKKENTKDLELYLHIGEDGLLDKVKFNENFTDESKQKIINQISSIPFGTQNQKWNKVKYCLKVRSMHSLGNYKQFGWMAVDSRVSSPIMEIYRLDKKYNVQDFLLLPEKNASPVGGYEAISSKIKYPMLAKYHDVQGRVVLKTFIDESGKVVGIQELTGQNFGIDKAAMDALFATKFKPAFNKEEPVKSQLIIPFEFKLDNETIQITRDIIDKEVAEYKAELEKEKSQKLDKLPEPIGGVDAIMKKVKYPNNAQIYGIEGSVVMDVEIDKKGNVTDITFVSKLGYDCDEAAEKAIRETKFKPAISNGKPVATKITIPVRFRLSDDEKDGAYKVVFEKSMNLNGKASVSGIVSDIDSHEPIVGGNVRIEGANRSAATYPDGKYNIINVPAGKYSFKLASGDHKQYSSEKIFLDEDTYYQIDFKLKKDKSNNLFKIVAFDKDKLQFNYKFYTLPKLLKALKSSNLDKDEKIDLTSDKTFTVDKNYLVKVRDRIRTIGYKNTFIKN